MIGKWNAPDASVWACSSGVVHGLSPYFVTTATSTPEAGVPSAHTMRPTRGAAAVSVRAMGSGQPASTRADAAHIPASGKRERLRDMWPHTTNPVYKRQTVDAKPLETSARQPATDCRTQVAARFVEGREGREPP